MSETFIVEKEGSADPREVKRLKALWASAYRGRIPKWFVRLWMRNHGWKAKPLVSFSRDETEWFEDQGDGIIGRNKYGWISK